ncbi:MAG: cytochrome c [Gammaproteobacteria bacterium]|nr:cytochrome c [Gammaproteobacteria bacterium]
MKTMKFFAVSPVIIALLLFGLSVGVAQSADRANGQVLHEKKCTSCHGVSQYTRPNRIVHTFGDLHARVEFCDSAANANFSPSDIDDVVAFLNARFYKFKELAE